VGIVFKNNAKTTLASSLSNSATSATVTDGSVFPSLSAGEFFLITFDDGSNNEICKCTARSGNTLTIVRAQESTTARAFSSGDAAEGRVTAGVLETIQENIAAKSANQTVFNTTTAGGATTYNIGTNPGVEANAMVFLNGVLQHHDTISFSGTNLTFDAAPPNGMALEVIIDNLINLQSSNLTVDTFTAADVSGNPQTDFTLSDTPAAETNLIVFVDGVFQDQDAYTISSNTLTITTGVIAGRGVTVYVINPVNIGTPSDSTVTSAKLSGNITMPGTLTVGSNDVAFDSPTFVVDHTNSRVGLGTASPSVPVDIVGEVKTSSHINIGGNLVKASGDLTLDVAGDIILDADGDDIKIAEGGNVVMEIKHESSSIDFSLNTGDEDFKFKGVDGGSTITALQLDISEAGKAIFNAGASFGSDISIASAGDGLSLSRSGYDTYSLQHSSGNGMAIYNVTDSRSEMFFAGDGNIGVGTNSPQSGIHISEGGSGSDGGSVLTLSHTGFGSIVNNDDLGSLHFGGVTSGGVGIHKSAIIMAEGDATWGSNDYPTRLTFHTTADGASSAAEKLRISSGNGVSSEAAVIRAADNVDIRSTHYANFEGGGWSSTDNNVNVRKALHEAVFGSYNVNFEPGAYSNGIYYVLAGKKANTANSYIKFKIALNKATHLKINQTVSNSADATARVTSIHYSFDDYVYTQAASAAFNAGSETTTATLDFDSIGTMSGQGSSYDGVFTGNIYVRMRLYLGSSSHESLIGWRSIGFEAKAADMKLINAGGPQYGPVETAMFSQTSASASNIVTNNGGYVDLAQHSKGGHMNPEIFEVDNTGNYGVHIKRDGKVIVAMSQDFIDSTTSGYLATRIYRAPANDANNTVISYELTGHTASSGQWMTCRNQCSFDVNAGDRVQFYIAGTAITHMDHGTWSQYTITWIDSQHSGSANRAVATYQENAHYNFIG
jgi:hypothetical protein